MPTYDQRAIVRAMGAYQQLRHAEQIALRRRHTLCYRLAQLSPVDLKECLKRITEADDEQAQSSDT